MKEALALCVRADPKHGDRAFFKPGVEPQKRSCSFCGVDLLAAPTTTAMESTPGLRVVYACNPCGKAEATGRGVKKLGIAPGALRGDLPEDRRRRNELEARGFRDIKPEEI